MLLLFSFSLAAVLAGGQVGQVGRPVRKGLGGGCWSSVWWRTKGGGRRSRDGLIREWPSTRGWKGGRGESGVLQQWAVAEDSGAWIM